MADDTSRPTRSSARDNWLPFIHGLRGVAALMVALFHCYFTTPVRDCLAQIVPSGLDGAIDLGFLGVDLFFVISGFVISLTLFGRLSSGAEWGRFFLRRQLRLDPPYWTAIALSIISAVAINWIRPATHAPVPSLGDVAAHIFYLQDFLGIKPIAGIFWTLCLEIQFYLFFGALVLLVARTRMSPRAFGWWMLPLFALSLACFWEVLPSLRGLFLPRWFEFFAGVVLFLRWRGHIGWPELGAYLGCLLLAALLHPATGNEIAAVTTATVMLIALLFLLAIEGKHLKRWLDSPLFRYFGSISYSLYLMHAIVGIRLLKIVVKADDSVARATLLYVGALLASIVASDLTFRLIERPSMEWSHRLKWRKAAPVQAPAQA